MVSAEYNGLVRRQQEIVTEYLPFSSIIYPLRVRVHNMSCNPMRLPTEHMSITAYAVGTRRGNMSRTHFLLRLHYGLLPLNACALPSKLPGGKSSSPLKAVPFDRLIDKAPSNLEQHEEKADNSIMRTPARHPEEETVPRTNAPLGKITYPKALFPYAIFRQPQERLNLQ
ncbi:uncharacterized protein BO96DRAFT_434382 [Aspergillus niger CBS 101883]|uniref:Contig An08c0010, genomic contig n=2 Tax=Aspergillus niger TaxID=5061 RepID=A2QPT6_ASPNC|nr:uncharacterized protein BO96DRAFT_434382 [Aspergillus niger CBS 101883]XP_059601118.1 uncharacterized protein An08g00120 [Aspergillus niger]PYH56403.1 hypothetical protein BO96DRAFT_434382 [Aspergillus niger CBS 101883]CAK39771.1 unnamed protein product [Aspergillus niger]